MQVNLKGQEMGSGSQLHLKGGVGSEWGGGVTGQSPHQLGWSWGSVCAEWKKVSKHTNLDATLSRRKC